MDYNPLVFFMIEINTPYQHYKNKEIYIPLNFCKIQENDIWVKAIIYRPSNSNELFVRTIKEFEEIFSKID